MKNILLAISLFLVLNSINAQTNIYTYDDLGRITKVEYQNGAEENISYDNVGNRTSYELDESALPVELLTFTAFPTPNQQLKTITKWQTSTEINTDYFEVQHALDGFDFKPIGLIRAAGNSNTVLQYDLEHDNPNYGVNYYRLITHDFDGTKDISHTVTVNFNKNYSIRLYPNPTQGIVTLQISREIKVDQRITITDELGRTYTPSITLSGENKWVIDMSSFIPGVYQITFIVDREYQTINVVVEPGR